ncbi:helix-turn-helix domain-containing protein [Erwinia sp. QL-Z3]|uniref:winged helix-turn-helix transcriptional regulator n=1 Tax=Erwinia sp. QL-Z3 TaxID=2547962 RepID=UPI0010713A88|nr:helix-turn-helix domain-containing protein [Erwinia sp. QL-Z3]QBR49526.1 transcriptional regulator [Erwinia sp. QL-Z3]
MKSDPLYQMSCPIARSLGRIGDSWSMLILRDMFAGLTRFDELQKSSNIAPNILTRRLKDLVEDGLLERVAYCEKPLRYEYQLTQMGRDFRPVILSLLQWGNNWLAPEGRSMQLVERSSGRVVELELTDKQTGRAITATEYASVPGPAADEAVRYRHDYVQQKRAGVAGKFVPPSIYRDPS